jgi:hypothetical protein
VPEPETGLKFRSGPCSSRLMARTSDKDAMPSWTGTREYPPTPSLAPGTDERSLRTTERSGSTLSKLSGRFTSSRRGQPNSASQRAQESVLGLREPAG